MEERERKRTGIGSLKIRYNQVFGYYIEISKANLQLAPAGLRAQADARRRGAVHFSELKEHERKVLRRRSASSKSSGGSTPKFGKSIAREAARLRQTAAAIAQLDVLANFARIAAARSYTRSGIHRSKSDRHRIAAKRDARRGEVLWWPAAGIR